MVVGDLLEHLDVRSCDLVPSALLHMDLWHMWRQLVEAAASNDIDWVLWCTFIITKLLFVCICIFIN